MDPYLEDPQLWSGVHNRLVVYLADQLQPVLQPRYVAAVEERVFVEGPDRQIIPDVSLTQAQAPRGAEPAAAAVAVAEADEPIVVQVPELEIHESYIEILDLRSGRNIVTVIEVVSPTNKYPGSGRDSYLAKQAEVRASTAHLVEIDLLRVGEHVLAVPQWAARGRGPYDYLTCVNRAGGLRDVFHFYPRRLTERLPTIGIPLADDDPDVPLDVQAGIAKVYEAGNYRARIDYQSQSHPPLEGDDRTWAEQLLAQQASGR